MKLEDLEDDGEGPEDDEDDSEGSAYDAEDFLEELGELVTRGHVQYARETLQDIYDTVEKTMRVSERQKRAVENIDEGGLRGMRRGMRRGRGY